MNYTYVVSPEKRLTHYHFVGDNISFKIYPNYGARLHELIWKNKTIIKGLENELALQKSNAYFNSALLFPFPNRLEAATFKHGGETFLLPKNCNNINAIHGCVYSQEFKAQEIKNDKIELIYHHLKNREFPFSFSLSVIYHFNETGVSLHLKCTNTGEKSFPFGFGWHPYLEAEDLEGAFVKMDAPIQYLTNELNIITETEEVSLHTLPLKENNLDTAFYIQDEKVSFINSKYTASFQIPKDSYLQLFIPNDRKSIAVEPMSCVGNSFNNQIGKNVIEPKQTVHWEIHLALSSK